MAKDAVIRTCMVWLAAIVVGVGVCTTTNSYKKMLATYLFGVFAISGLLLPDWEFFARDFSQWSTPVALDDDDHHTTTSLPSPTHTSVWKRLVSFPLVALDDDDHHTTTSLPSPTHTSVWKRFRIYPLRLMVYTVVYWYGLYKWWMYVSN